MSNNNNVPGFMGTHHDVNYVNDAAAGAEPAREDFDLVAMARWCQNYLANNPVREPDWQCRFSLWGLHMPVFDPWPYNENHEPMPDIGLVDPITAGDTDVRMDYAYVYMREMAGDYDAFHEAEEGIRGRILSYIADDGLCYVYGPIVVDFKQPDPKPRTYPWVIVKAMLAESERYRLSGDEGHRRLARKLFEGVRSLAEWDTGRAFYPGSTWREGEWTPITGYGVYHTAVGQPRPILAVDR